jgi:hypothetical protein
VSERDLEISQLTGQWGFSLQTKALTNIQSGDLLSLTLPAHLARSWVVHLNAFRFSGGTLGTATQPPDNQTDTSGSVRASIQWGVDSANERALVDYPARGATFEVQASVIRLQLVSATNFGNNAEPLLGGYIAPAGGRGQTRYPTLTTLRQNQANDLVFDFPVADRAFGYRIMPLQIGAGATAFLKLTQRDGVLTQVTYDGNFDYGSSNFFQQDGMMMPQWWPLHPQTQFVRVDTTGNTVGSLVYAIQWFLDLG